MKRKGRKKFLCMILLTVISIVFCLQTVMAGTVAGIQKESVFENNEDINISQMPMSSENPPTPVACSPIIYPSTPTCPGLTPSPSPEDDWQPTPVSQSPAPSFQTEQIRDAYEYSTSADTIVKGTIQSIETITVEQYTYPAGIREVNTYYAMKMTVEEVLKGDTAVIGEEITFLEFICGTIYDPRGVIAADGIAMFVGAFYKGYEGTTVISFLNTERKLGGEQFRICYYDAKQIDAEKDLYLTRKWDKEGFVFQYEEKNKYFDFGKGEYDPDTTIPTTDPTPTCPGIQQSPTPGGPTCVEPSPDNSPAVPGRTFNTIFEDIANDFWGAKYITSLAGQGIVSGYTTGTEKYEFRPNANITRAEFVTILVNAYDVFHDDADADSFWDVKREDWCYKAVVSAVEEGLTAGYPDRSFAPDSAVTREEMMTLNARALMRYRDYIWLEEDEAAQLLQERFTDGAQVQDYAKKAVALNVENEIVTGYAMENGTYELRPGNPITRAEVCVILDQSK